MESKIKILVCYHKQSLLYKNSILAPIHAGRAPLREKAEKDISQHTDFAWLCENMPGDDTGENISALNPKLSEMTAMYWAWKNYETLLGNPEYVGLMHYRRFLDFACPQGQAAGQGYVLTLARSLHPQVIENTVKGHDLCINKFLDHFETVTEQYASCHNVDDILAAYSVIERLTPEYLPALVEYAEGHKHFICNLFVMKKNIFMDYAAWMFRIMLTVERKINYSGYDDYQTRALAFLSERLSGIYLTRLMQTGQYDMLQLPFFFA